jgi:hypothetical protein
MYDFIKYVGEVELILYLNMGVFIPPKVGKTKPPLTHNKVFNQNIHFLNKTTLLPYLRVNNKNPNPPIIR